MRQDQPVKPLLASTLIASLLPMSASAASFLDDIYSESLSTETNIETTVIPSGGGPPVNGSDDQGISAMSPGLPNTWAHTVQASASSVSGTEYVEASGSSSLSRTFLTDGSAQVAETTSVTADGTAGYINGFSFSQWMVYFQVTSPSKISLDWELAALRIPDVSLFNQTTGSDVLLFSTSNLFPVTSGVYTDLLEPGTYRLIASTYQGLGSEFPPFSSAAGLDLSVALTSSSVPEPDSAWLMLAGFVGLYGAFRKGKALK